MCKKEYVSLIIPLTGTTILIYWSLHEFVRVVILIISFFIFLWNFPEISRSLYSRPLYIGDIENSKFEKSYINTMNIILAIGCAVGVENWIIKKLIAGHGYFEITGVIGGNITFFATIQNYFAKMLLSICHKCKVNEEARSRRGSEDHESDLSDSTPLRMVDQNPLHIDVENNHDLFIHSPHNSSPSTTKSELNNNIAMLTEQLNERNQILESLHIRPLDPLKK